MSVRRARVAALLAAAVGGCATLGLQQPGTADAPETLRVVLTDTGRRSACPRAEASFIVGP